MSDNEYCSTCLSIDKQVFFELPPIPTMDGVMSSSVDVAMNSPRGEVRLSFCNQCGSIRNEAYEAEKVSFTEYDFSNDHSPIFAKYVDKLTTELVDKYQLHAKFIMDVGCGDGAFLQSLCQKGANRGLGIDPGFDHSGRSLPVGLDVRFVQDLYTEAYENLAPDFVACRHVLNVIDDQMALIKSLRNNIGENGRTVVYFEVPNMLYTFKEKVIWNVTYENRAWYTIEVLEYLLRSCGFDVLATDLRWNDEFISVEVSPAPADQKVALPDSELIAKIKEILTEFCHEYQSAKIEYEAGIETIKREGHKTIAWGAGARAVTFFNIFNIASEIPCIVDINTKRQGKYLPGTAQEIISPQDLHSIRPDQIVITNPTYADEIKDEVRKMGLDPIYWIL